MNLSNLILTCILLLIHTCNLNSQPFYTNVAAERGITTKKEIYTIGNGVSFRDFNNDGWDDLTLATEEGKLIDFYINVNGMFHKIDPLVQNMDEVKQILWVDFDNDGDQDLYIATFLASNRLYERIDQFQLIDITEQSGLSLEENISYGAVWGDYNRDGWLDLHYSDRNEDYRLNGNQLYLNNGDGTFTKTSKSANVFDQGKIPFFSAFLDYNNDNWPDIYTANDKLTTNTLLKNNGDCTFSDMSAESLSALRMNAMCVAVGDYDNNGWQDIYITNTPIGNTLLNNNSSGLFKNVSDSSGTRYFGNGWGSIFLDGDNDGLLDLYVSGSMVGADVISNIFYKNIGGGKFEEASMGFLGDTTSSFANAYGDFNQDGYPDIIVQNNPPFSYHLWENSGFENNWLKIKLQGLVSNRDGVGSLIKIYTGDRVQSRYTHCGIGFLGQNSNDQLIGIEKYESIDSVLILWPSGHEDKLYGITPNQKIMVIEGISTNGQIFSTITSQKCDADQPEMIVEEVLSITDDQFKIFPNPFSVNLSMLGMDNNNHTVIISDLSGKVYASFKSDFENLDVSFLSCQIYLLSIYTNNQLVATRKIVKN